MQITITNEQQIEVTLNPVTSSGNPAPLDGNPVWEVLTGNSTVIPSADGKSAILRSEDGIGDTQIKVTGDADLGAGVVEISDTIELIVIGAQAQSLGLVPGTAQPKT